jgi:hypothetical protein
MTETGPLWCLSVSVLLVVEMQERKRLYIDLPIRLKRPAFDSPSVTLKYIVKGSVREYNQRAQIAAKLNP